MKRVPTRTEALLLARDKGRDCRVYPTGNGWAVAPLTEKNASKGKMRGITVRFTAKKG